MTASHPAIPPQKRLLAHTSWPMRLSLLLLVLFSFGLHIWRIDAKSIWWDESLSLARARESIPFIVSNRIDLPGSSSTDLHPPLYFLLLHVMLRFSGESDLVLRFPSAAFAALLVPLLYAMGVRLRGPRAGLLGALFGALSPFYLWYAQEARMYTMVAALGLASVYSLWRACTEQKQSWGLAFGLAAAAAMATQYLFALVILCEALLGYLLWPRLSATKLAPGSRGIGRRRVTLFWGVGILLLVLVPLSVKVVGLALWPKAGRWYVPLGIMLRDALNSFSLGLSVELGEVWPLDVVFLGVYLVGLASLWHRPADIVSGAEGRATWRARSAGLVVLLAYILLPILGMWLFSLYAPIYMGSRYVMMCSPALYLGLGIGLDALAGWKRAVAASLAVMLIASMGLSVYRYFHDERYRTKEDHRSAAQYVEANERPRDVIVVTAPENITAFTHYYQGSLPVVGVPRVSLTGGPDPGQLADDLAALAGSYDRLWLVHCRTMFSDPEDLVTKWLDSHTMRLEHRVLSGYGSLVTINAYLPISPIVPCPASPQRSVGSFEGRLLLVDYRLHYVDPGGQVHEVPAQEARNASVSLSPADEGAIAAGRVVSTLSFWQPLKQLDVYKTSLRLVDAQGAVWAQYDREPFMTLPTSAWPLDAQVKSESGLLIPFGTPPGAYHLQLWLYEASNGRALTFREDATGAERAFVDLGQVTVGRARRRFYVREFVPASAERAPWVTVFGENVELLAWDMAPRTLKAGQPLELHFYWRARKSALPECDLVLNWEDPQGRIWRATHHSLTGTEYATSRWQKGDLVRGLLRVIVPAEAPPGRYTLHLLVFARQSQRFLWLRQGIVPFAGHNLQIARITVE